jgi:hypothetical protein
VTRSVCWLLLPLAMLPAAPVLLPVPAPVLLPVPVPVLLPLPIPLLRSEPPCNEPVTSTCEFTYCWSCS